LSRDVLSRAPVAHHPDDLFQCQMRSSVSECLTFSCSRNIRMTYYRYPNQMCYTIDSYQGTNSTHPIHRCPSPWNYELILRAQWNTSATVSLHEPEALPLVIHSPYTCPPDKLSSVMVQPGMTYTVAVSQAELRRASLSPFCHAPSGMVSFRWYLELQCCRQTVRNAVRNRMCGCVSRSTSEKEKKKRSEKGYLGIQFAHDALCLFVYLMVCREIRYDLKLSSLALDKVRGEKPRIAIYSDKFSFIIKFSSDTQKVSEYQPNLPVIEAFGFFGGYIGIWLGFSLLSVLLDLEAKIMKAISRKTEKYVT
ncbi:unnamed protein product, partial [Ixodes persulcatus]